MPDLPSLQDDYLPLVELGGGPTGSLSPFLKGLVPPGGAFLLSGWTGNAGSADGGTTGKHNPVSQRTLRKRYLLISDLRIENWEAIASLVATGRHDS
jgi:hypothetical protein